MTLLPHYALNEKVHETDETAIYRGVRATDGAPVAIKLLRSEYPSPRSLVALRHEYTVLCSLPVEGVVKVLGLEPYGRSLAIVMEDLGGLPLSHVLRAQRPDLTTVLRIAVSPASTLEQIHRRRVIHKDLKPANVVVDLATMRVTLIDFGISTQLSQETPRGASPDALEGTPAYIAPEQTGRMNRSVDTRADLYSFGVTLYELLTGVLPFRATDRLELIHSHIARTPRSRTSSTRAFRRRSRRSYCVEPLHELDDRPDRRRVHEPELPKVDRDLATAEPIGEIAEERHEHGAWVARVAHAVPHHRDHRRGLGELDGQFIKNEGLKCALHGIPRLAMIVRVGATYA